MCLPTFQRNKMKKKLIQANNLERVIDIFIYIYNHPNSTKNNVAEYSGITLRQVDYYLGACFYLDLLDEKMKPTKIANEIFEKYRFKVRDCVYERIFIDDIYGKIIRRKLFYPELDIYEYASKIVRENYSGYSEAVYERRIDNIIKWCEKILKYLIDRGV